MERFIDVFRIIMIYRATEKAPSPEWNVILLQFLYHSKVHRVLFTLRFKTGPSVYMCLRKTAKSDY